MPYLQGMEHDRLTRTAPRASEAGRTSSFVDCLFEMPEAVAKRASEEDRAASGRLEARLSADMRAVIAARLRNDDAA